MAEIQKSTNEKRTEEFVARILHLMGGAKMVQPDRLVGVKKKNKAIIQLFQFIAFIFIYLYLFSLIIIQQSSSKIMTTKQQQ